MSVEIDPVELGFCRPFTVEVSQLLKIRNPNTIPVAFKVKTTAPKQYCVRPNSGRIEPGHDVEVTVLLQAMKQDPPLGAKCRDKFLVQSVPITGDKEFVSVQEIWDSVDKAAIQEKKIRVSFLPAEGGADAPSAATPVRESLTNGADATPDAPPPAYSSSHDDDATSNAVSHFEPSPSAKHEVKSEPGVKSEPEELPPAVSGIAAASAKDTAVETLRAQLAQAEAKIASLRAEGGLRQGNGTGAGAGEGSANTQQLQDLVRQGTEGVPVQVAAILCLLAFLLAYFFF